MSSTGPTLYIIIHSLWGHIHKLALAELRGAASVAGVTTKLFRVNETLPEEVLAKMYAAPPADVPVLAPTDMVHADAFLFGVPTRYGQGPAQLKAFWDATGGLWAKGALVGKQAGIFSSTATQHGGLETTAHTFLTHFVHHGIHFVPLGYTHPHLSIVDEVIGAGPWGAGTVTKSDGSRQPSEKELEVAEFQGKQMAEAVLRWHNGKKA